MGAIFRNAKIAGALMRIFEEDWAASESHQQTGASDEEGADSVKIARKVAKAVAKEIPPVAPLLDGVVKKVVGEDRPVALNEEEVEEIVKGAVKEAVRDALRDVVEGVVDGHPGRPA